jgi:hypothetical protein
MRSKNEMTVEQYIAFPKIARKSLPKLIASLDRIFSVYIRLRDADKNGICRCITCGKPFHWKEGDAGHFIPRDRKATRWDECNVNAQCHRCNRFRSGEQYDHGLAIDRKYGEGTAEKLKNMGSLRSKVSAGWLEYQIEEYRKKVGKLKERIDV